MKIQSIYEASRQTYGSPRIHAELKEQGETCSRQRVARIMNQAGIVAKMTKKFKVTTKKNPKAKAAPNLLQQNFTAEQPNRRWVADLTYISTLEGWLYVAVVLDLFSRRIVGLAMGDRMTDDLVLAALEQALIHRNPLPGLLHHSDQGSQYTSHDFQKMLANHQISISMDGKGNCYGRVKQWRGDLKVPFPLPAASNRTCATHASGFRLDPHTFAFGTSAMTSAIA